MSSYDYGIYSNPMHPAHTLYYSTVPDEIAARLAESEDSEEELEKKKPKIEKVFGDIQTIEGSLRRASSAQASQPQDTSVPKLYPESMRYEYVDKTAGTRTTHEIKFRTDGNKIADSEGNTWLHVACRGGSEDMLLGFIQKAGKELNLEVRNQKDQTPLMVAVEAGRQKIVEALIENGADVNARQWETGETALFIAASRGDLQLTQLLLSKEARITEARKAWGSYEVVSVTPVFYAASTGNIELVQLLIDAGDNPHRILQGGNNILCYAALHPPLMRILYLVHKVNINEKCTPLLYIQDIDLFIFFLENGAEVDEGLFCDRIDGVSPKNGSRIDFVIALLKRKATALPPASLQKVFIKFSEALARHKVHELGVTSEKLLEATQRFLSSGAKINSKIRVNYDNYLEYNSHPELKKLIEVNDSCVIS